MLTALSGRHQRLPDSPGALEHEMWVRAFLLADGEWELGPRICVTGRLADSGPLPP